MTNWLRRGTTAEIEDEIEELLTTEEEINAREALRLAVLGREALLGGLSVRGAFTARHNCLREDLGGSISITHIACNQSHAVIFANVAVVVGEKTRLFIGDEAQSLPSLFTTGENDVLAMWGFDADGMEQRNAVVVTPVAAVVLTKESTFVVRVGGGIEEFGPALGNALRALLLP